VTDLSQADKRAIWAALEDLDNNRGPMVAWLPSGPLKDLLEGALGKIVSAQWRLAKELGGRRMDEPAETGGEQLYSG
jgi:hypothetical protein